MKKAAIQISMTFLVGLIMGIVLFALGLVFAFRLIAGAPEPIDLTQFDIDQCIQSGERVCLPKIREDLQTNQVGMFGVVINNNIDETKDFKPIVTFSKGVLENGQEVSQNIVEWTFDDFKSFELENNRHEIVDIPLKVPPGTKPGTYVFNVNVCFDSSANPSSKCPGSFKSLYSPTNQIRITVN